MDPFLDVYHSLTELLTHVEPMMVAYISPDNGESHGIAGSTAALTRGGGVGDNVVVAAVEAAVRSTGAARHPVALPLPATVDGAKAAKVCVWGAYLYFPCQSCETVEHASSGGRSFVPIRAVFDG